VISLKAEYGIKKMFSPIQMMKRLCKVNACPLMIWCLFPGDCFMIKSVNRLYLQR
jgi:hypothetical protein